jgi:predicted component of type VI protein secretion system
VNFLISPFLLLGIPLGVIVIAVIFGYFLPGMKRRKHLNSPIAIAPFGRDRAVIPPRPVRPEPSPVAPADKAPAPRGAAPAVEDVEVPVARSATLQHEARAYRAPTVEREEPGRVLKLQVAGDPRSGAPAANGSSGLRLERSADGTLQFLPGKLEVVEGRNVGQELRFVRTPGPDGQTVTFGRNEGPQYRHVQLDEHTVSRMHAQMSLDGKTWTLSNLSKTNPAVVNGLALGPDNSTVILRDGDRIEMGEVVFRFRSR